MDSPVLDRVAGITVVRDDKVAGGTKARVLPGILSEIGAGHEIVYATPAYGYAQIALAHAASLTGRHATVFVARRTRWHPRTVEAARAGAAIIEVPHGYLTVVRARARAYCEETGATLLPFGLDLPAMRAGMAEVARALPLAPAEVWTVAGSGTLIRGLQEAWPAASFHAVQVGRDPLVGRARLWVAPETFERNAAYPPPFPSCSNFDAKAWRFVREHAAPGALFWNVAA